MNVLFVLLRTAGVLGTVAVLAVMTAYAYAPSSWLSPERIKTRRYRYGRHLVIGLWLLAIIVLLSLAESD